MGLSSHHLSVFAFALTLECVIGQGILIFPQSRSIVAHSPQLQLNCGGIQVQHEQNNGTCGVCGDPANGPQNNMAGGIYAAGDIKQSFKNNGDFQAIVQVDRKFGGRFEFDICENNNISAMATETCFTALGIKNHGLSYNVLQTSASTITLSLELPYWLECSQCILRWRWMTDSLVQGVHKSREIRNCADLAITGGRKTGLPTATATSTTAQSPPPPTTTTAAASTITTTIPPSTTTAATTLLSTTGASGVAGLNSHANGDWYYLCVDSNKCKAVGIFTGMGSMDWWCSRTCCAGPCPASACGCSFRNTVSLPKTTHASPITTTASTTKNTTTTAPTTTTTTTTTTALTTTTSAPISNFKINGMTGIRSGTGVAGLKPQTWQGMSYLHCLLKLNCELTEVYAGSFPMEGWCKITCCKGHCPQSACLCSIGAQ